MKWLKRILYSLLAIVLYALLVFYVWSARIIDRKYPAQLRDIVPASAPEALQHGERMAQVFGCFSGCHGRDMEGEVFFEGLAIGRIISPNLTRAAEQFSPSEFEAIVRQGIRPDGTSVMGMPSASFATMTNEDLSAILGFIERYPKQDLDLGHSRYGILPRAFVILGEFVPAAAKVEGAPWQSSDLQDPLKQGQYLGMNACSECHGMDLEGQDGFTPGLQIVKGYSLEDFKNLMSTGMGIGDRDLGLMTVVATHRFKKMTSEEMEALHRFLTTR